MVGACIVFQTTSYVVPQGILAWRGRDKVLPQRALNLGKFGLPLNVLACVWVFFIDIIYCVRILQHLTMSLLLLLRSPLQSSKANRNVDSCLPTSDGGEHELDQVSQCLK